MMIDRTEAITLGIDPGYQVGYSDGRDYHGEMDYREFIVLFDAGMWHRVVIEAFHMRRVTVDAEITLRVIGAIEALCARARVPVGWVEPSARLKTIKDVSNGYRGRHERDAEAVRLWDLAYGDWG